MAAKVYWLEIATRREAGPAYCGGEYGWGSHSPAPTTSATRVHEYGGGAWTVSGAARASTSLTMPTAACTAAGPAPQPITAAGAFPVLPMGSSTRRRGPVGSGVRERPLGARRANQYSGEHRNPDSGSAKR